MTTCCFIEPHDVLFLRGNQLFGEAGSYGESLVPPHPSVIAGAIRSALMVRKGIDFGAFANNRDFMDAEFGNAARPGAFRLTDVQLAHRGKNSKVAPLYALPADLISLCRVRAQDEQSGDRVVRRIMPGTANTLMTSAVTAHLAVLPEPERGKPESGFYLSAAGWRAYLSGEPIVDSHLLAQDKLWQTEVRTGIGIEAASGSVAEGRLFTTQAVSFQQRHQGNDYDVGFLARTEGAEWPPSLTLRLGGDGRAAQASLIDGADVDGEPDWEALWEQISANQRCRIVLISPGIFAGGWRPTGLDESRQFNLGGVTAKLVCAAVPRSKIISGWDLAAKQPKPAQRVAPTGSVYWLQDLQATPDALHKLAIYGLWPDGADNGARRVEGYNRFVFATY